MQEDEYNAEMEKLYKEKILSRDLCRLIIEQISDGSILARAGINNMRIVKDFVLSGNEIEAEIEGFYLDRKHQEAENITINKDNFVEFLNKLFMFNYWCIDLILSDKKL